MKTFKAKLTALFIAAGCFLACFGVGVATLDALQQTNITASAETVRTITKAGATNDSSATAIYVYALEGDATGSGNWYDNFFFVADSGKGIKFNDVTLDGYDMKQPGNDIYLGLGGKSAVAGDEVTLDGTFYCEKLESKIVFKNCGLRYNGSTWDSFTPPIVHNIGALVLHGNSVTGGAKGDNTVLYLQRADGGALPILTWDHAFTYESGSGFKVNGVQKTPATIKSTGDGFYWQFDALAAGDSVLIGGTFYCESQNVKYVIEESIFQWTGASWIKFAEYDKLNVGELQYSHGNAQHVYLKPVDESVILPINSWGDAFSYVSGNGITIDGVMISMINSVKSPDGAFFVDLGGAANTDAILKIEGTFRCEAYELDYVIKESTFQWNGSTWVPYIEYKTYNVGKVKIGNNSSSTAVYFDKASGEAFEKTDGTWTEKLTYESGVGVTFNGEKLAMNDIKIPNNVYVSLEGKTAKQGDIVVIGGTFYNEKLAVKYIIEESAFQWNGSTWVPYIGYKTYNVGKVKIGNNSSATAVYFDKASGEAFEKTDGTWTEKLTYESGVGVTFNGEKLAMNDIKIPNNVYVGLEGKTAKQGDIVVIGGTFYNEKLAVKYIIEESKFQYNGSAWVEYVEYRQFNVGALKYSHGGAGEVYLNPVDDNVTLPISSWDYAFSYVSGSGITVDGVMISMENSVKSPGGNSFYAKLGKNASVGAILKIEGVFRCDAQGIDYVIGESTFQWNGTVWVPYVEYKTYNVGKVTIGADSNASAVHFANANGNNLEVPTGWDEKFTFVEGSGIGVTLNGKQINMNDIKVPGTLYVGLGTTAKAGDVLAIGGAFYNETYTVKYVIEVSEFVWSGAAWIVDYSNLEYEQYDEITIFDLGLGLEKTVEGENKKYSGLAYMPSEENTTGSVVFRFGYNSVNTAAGELALRFRGSAWNGIRFQIAGGKLQSLFGANTSVALENNTDYVIELGLIDTADGNSIWGYAKVNGIMHISELINKSDVNVYGEQGTELFGSYTTSHVSIYAATNTTLTDPDHITVTYRTCDAEGYEIDYTEYAKKGCEYTLTTPKTYQTFIAWVAENGELYDAGDTIAIADDVEALLFEAVRIDFEMDDGAAIRIAGTAGTSGIRFTTRILADEIDYLSRLTGVVDISFGTLIMPYDYLKTTGQKPNLTDFEAYDGTENIIIGETILKLKSSEEKRETIDGYIVYRGAMQNIKEANYGRLFAGRGYMEITFDDGTVKTVYTPFEIEDHVRSVRNVAQKFQADDSVAENGTLRYEGLSDALKSIVDEYAASDAINLMDYDAYKVNTFLNVIAWYYPELDPTNGYNNDHNKEIAEKMKAAGIRAIYLDGKYHLDLVTMENIEKTRQIIKYFWDKHGLYTIAFGSNASNNFNLDYSAVDFPDFSDCEGFIGFLVWDEPGSERMDTLADFVNNFEKVYAGSNATFMVNLLPSYASVFSKDSNSIFDIFDSQIDKLDKNAYKNYLANYCESVLSELDGGEKWLSLDSYPIKADKSLSPYFLFDLAMLKTTALDYDAHAHIALQACGWKEGTSTTMYRMPTEAEMRMQAYAAMAFGIDSISWWSYGDMRDEEQYNPTDDSDYYTRFANVNNELAAIGHVYKAFEWKGVILGAGKDNPTWNSATKTYVDNDYEACNAVKGQIGDYELSASDTKHLSKVATNKTDWNYLLGVMEDMNGNEGYVLCNYNNHSSDRAQTITLTFKTNVTQVIIYRGGVAATENVSSKELTISLATGEGVIVLPSKLG